MAVIGIIPARFASTRFPGKPLADINGKSMIRRVYEQASRARNIAELIVATDDERIAEHCRSFNAKVLITQAGHPSGTDRCFEAYRINKTTYSHVINIQGDEPFLDPQQIDSLAEACDEKTEIATQMIRCSSHDVLFDPGEVKIVLNRNDEALYFSRSVIPYIKNTPEKDWHLVHEYFRHVGMYAYRTDILEKITSLKVSGLEKAESLEQLRWLENGFRIRCVKTEFESHCIDSPEDIEKVARLMNQQ